MRSPASATRLAVPLSKRCVFTTITPLPAHASRAAVVAFLHDYEAMIDVNPLVTDRYQIVPPRDADPDEARCVWYQLTDAVALPWASQPPPTSSDGSSAKQKPGNVSYTCVFHPLPDGLQTHCRAPLGVDVRDRWTVGGTAPGEPKQPVELGLDALGAPASGLYLREDVDLRCSRLMAGFVRKTLEKSHESVVQKLSAHLSRSRAAGVGAGASSTTVGTILPATGETAAPSAARYRPVSFSAASPARAARPMPYRVYPQQQQQYRAFRPPLGQRQQAPQQQQQQQQRLQRQSMPQQPSRPHDYLQHQHRQQQPSSHRQHQHALSCSHAAPTHSPSPRLQNESVPAFLSVPAAMPVPAAFAAPAAQPVSAPSPLAPAVSLSSALASMAIPSALAVGLPPQQNTQSPRPAHPILQRKVSDERIAVDLSSLSSSPCTSLSSVSAASTASSAAAAALPSPARSSASSLPGPQPIPYDRFAMNASPLTRLQLQLPKVAAAEMSGASSSNAEPACYASLTQKEQRHSLARQLLPPLVLSASEAAAREPRRKSTGSSMHGPFGIARPPTHDPSLCPAPLRIGGQRRASANLPPAQSRPTEEATSKALDQPFQDARPAVAAFPCLPFSLPETTAASPATSAMEKAQADSLAELLGKLDEATRHPVYPDLDPEDPDYVYNEDDYEDIYVDTPVDPPPAVAADTRARQHRLYYAPTVFAELDTASAKTIEPVVAGPVPEWQQWRRFLQADMD